LHPGSAQHRGPSIRISVCMRQLAIAVPGSIGSLGSPPGPGSGVAIRL